MAADRDIVLADERGSAELMLDEDLAEGIAFVGFDDDDGFGDAALIGFDEDSTSADRTGATPAAPRELRRAMAVRAAALALYIRLLQQFAGSPLRIRRLRAAVVPAIALLAAVGIGLAVRSWLPARQSAPIVAQPVVPPSGPSVLVASRPIRRGEILRRSDVQWRPWPLAGIKPSYFVEGARRLSEFKGYVVRTQIAAGQPLAAGDIVAPAGRGFMAAMLQPGMRAISVAIGPETAASGLILPGDDVDIMLSMPVPAFDANGNIASQERASVVTLLRNIRVLAIDQETNGDAYRSIIGNAATLEVTPKQAEIVTLANELASRGGMLVLALRSIRDVPERMDAAGAPSYLLDTDVSKLLTDRPVSPLRPPQQLAIVRRGKRWER